MSDLINIDRVTEQKMLAKERVDTRKNLQEQRSIQSLDSTQLANSPLLLAATSHLSYTFPTSLVAIPEEERKKIKQKSYLLVNELQTLITNHSDEMQKNDDLSAPEKNPKAPSETEKQQAIADRRA